MKKLIFVALSLLAAAAAQASIVTVNFNTINGNATYTESGFTFTVGPNGNHTDASDYMYFHDGGANNGDVQLTLTFGGNLFSLVSFDYMYGNGASVLGSNGNTVSFADKFDQVRTSTLINLDNVTSVVFRQNSGGNFMFDNLVIDNAPNAVPEPSSLALLGLGLGLAGFAAIRRRKA